MHPFTKGLIEVQPAEASHIYTCIDLGGKGEMSHLGLIMFGFTLVLDDNSWTPSIIVSRKTSGCKDAQCNETGQV